MWLDICPYNAVIVSDGHVILQYNDPDFWIELNQIHIVTDFVIYKNIKSSVKQIDIISYCDKAGDLHP